MRLFAPFFCLVAVVLALPLNAAQTAPPLTIAFEGKGITAAGLTPGGGAVLFMMSRQPDVFMTQLKQRNAMLTVGADGKAGYQDDEAVADRSVWGVIDVESARYAIACPLNDCAAQQLALSTASFFKNNAAGEPEGLDIPLERADVFLVSPKGGVWHAFLGDGGKRDEDGLVDGKARISIEKFTGFHTDEPPPKKLKKGDLLLCFQPMSLEFAVVEVVK